MLLTHIMRRCNDAQGNQLGHSLASLQILLLGEQRHDECEQFA